MRAGTPKNRFLGFCSQNDVVLDLYDTKRHRFGWQKFFFLKFSRTSQNDVIWDYHSPKRFRFGIVLGYLSKTTSCG